MSVEGSTLADRMQTILRIVRWPALIALFFGLSSLLALGPIARTRLEETLEQTLGTKVVVERVAVRLAGALTIPHLGIASGPDAEPGDTLRLQGARIEASARQLFDQDIRIDRIAFDSCHVVFGWHQGKGNFLALLDRMRKRVAAAETAAEGKASRRFRATTVSIANVELEFQGDLATEGSRVTTLGRLEFSLEEPLTSCQLIEKCVLRLAAFLVEAEAKNFVDFGEASRELRDRLEPRSDGTGPAPPSPGAASGAESGPAPEEGKASPGKRASEKT